ncbi:hypothetical protein BFF78_20735 [Streptomyces fodineus]|uniref:Uncharacterized protein n=1 Tax=Streptomyces fodineus TaxID=1904616 RepID=A0A1D7YC20_9ACTN|nr:hypothetical protein BFF78_20735 [Streptomyces fodineus]
MCARTRGEGGEAAGLPALVAAVGAGVAAWAGPVFAAVISAATATTAAATPRTYLVFCRS